MNFENKFSTNECKFSSYEIGITDRKEIVSEQIALAYIPNNISELNSALEENPCPTLNELQTACNTGVYDFNH